MQKVLGVYNYVISWVILAVVFVKCGFEDYLTREIAVFWSQQEVGKGKICMGLRFSDAYY